MRNRVVRTCVVAVVAGVLCGVSPALAAFPGQNGKIAFSSDRDGDTEIYVMNPDGTGQTALTTNTIADSNPAWSPDGARIAFERAGSFFTEIWVMNADGTAPAQIYPDGIDPAWSPDGTQIAFARSSGIAVVNADGTGFQELTPSAAPGFEVNIDSEPAWSPDGATILFTRFGDVQGGAEPEKIYAVNADGTGVRQVTPDITFGEANNTDTGSEWAPGGPQFAYSRIVDDPDFFHGLQITTSADPYNYTTLNPAGGHPAWAPDGSTIAFELGDDIHAVPAAGGTSTNLTTRRRQRPRSELAADPRERVSAPARRHADPRHARTRLPPMHGTGPHARPIADAPRLLRAPAALHRADDGHARRESCSRPTEPER